MRVRFLAPLFFALSACAGASVTDAGSIDVFARPGPFPIGVTHVELTSSDGGRSLPVEVWYPAAPSTPAADFAVEDFETGARRDQLAAWIQQAPAACTPRRAQGTRDATPATPGSAGWPLLVFSHCTECFRFSFHSVTERLASHGFVVAAPDHVDNTRFDASASITNAFLAVRAGDISDVIDAMLDANDPRVPASLRGHLDASRVAVLGHSFGAVTAGKVVELDARVKAGLLFAAPVDSPFLNSGAAANVPRPLSWVLATEDNSISYLGNDFIRDNFTKVPRPNWLVEVENAGHWSFSDIAGLGGDYLAGCGDGLRDPDGGAFTYLDNRDARFIAQRTAAAWASFVLRGDTDAGLALGLETPIVHVKARTP